jgi:hypothetical protein
LCAESLNSADFDKGEYGRAHQSQKQSFELKLIILGKNLVDATANAVRHHQLGGCCATNLIAKRVDLRFERWPVLRKPLLPREWRYVAALQYSQNVGIFPDLFEFLVKLRFGAAKRGYDVLDGDSHTLQVAFHTFQREFVAAKDMILERLQPPKEGRQSFVGEKARKRIDISLAEALNIFACNGCFQREANAIPFLFGLARPNHIEDRLEPPARVSHPVTHLFKCHPAKLSDHLHGLAEHILVRFGGEGTAIPVPV